MCVVFPEFRYESIGRELCKSGLRGEFAYRVLGCPGGVGVAALRCVEFGGCFEYL